MKTAVITGISGQDGALLASFLLKNHYHVIGLLPAQRDSDLFRLDYLKIRTKITLRKIDQLAIKEIEEFLEETKPDEFYNLAALSSVGQSFTQPYLTFDFNTRSVITLLESIRRVAPQTKFYQASSSEMFGNVGRSSLPIRESFLFHPASPYGISKASAHWLTVNYREAYKLRACCGILFNHESALRPSHFVIKKIIRTALDIKAGRQQNLVMGNMAIARDWGYAPLYVEAMWKMMQQERLNDYLICSGSPVYLKDFVSEVFVQVGLDAADYLSIDAALMRALDLEIIYGDNSKARKELSWEYDMTTTELIKNLLTDEIDFMNWHSLLTLHS